MRCVDPYSQRLFDVVDRVVDDWLSARADAVLMRAGRVTGVDLIESAKRQAAATVRRDLADLLALDVFDQRRNPLEILRAATQPLTRALRTLGVDEVERDDFQRRSFPDDIFDLCPATWTDVHADLAEVGLEWGAWKAATVLSRRRSSTNESDDPT